MAKKVGPGGPPRGNLTTPSAKPLPTDVDQPDEGTVYVIPGTPTRKTVPTKDLITTIHGVIADALLSGQFTMKFINALRVQLDLILIMISCPTTIKKLSHPPNSDTKLVPAVQALLDNAAAIEDQNQLALKDQDLAALQEHLDALPLYKALWKVFDLGSFCAEAGVTQLEQDMDGTVREVAPRLSTLIDDRDFEERLRAITDLASGSQIDAANTRRQNERKAAAGGETNPTGPTPHQPPGQGGTPPAQGGTPPAQGGTPPGQGPGPVISGPLPVQGQPAGKTRSGRTRSSGNKKKK